MRSRTIYFNLGLMPLATIIKNFDYSQQHSYTRYGVYGIKL
jgi:ribosomal protein S3